MDPQTSSRRTILLADNEQFITKVYKEGLEHAGYEVVVAKSGQEALEVLRNNPPSVVVMDLILPQINGFEVLQTMREDAVLKNIPVLILTNLSQDSDKAEAGEYDIADFLVKSSTSLKDLLDRLHSLGLSS